MIDLFVSILKPLLLLLIFFLLARQAIRVWREKKLDKCYTLNLLNIIGVGAIYGLIATHDDCLQFCLIAAIGILVVTMTVKYWLIYLNDDNETTPDIDDIDLFDWQSDEK